MTKTASRERPIILYPHEVRAALDGRLTQVRRPVKHRYSLEIGEDESGNPWPYFPCYVFAEPEPIRFECPFGTPGDRLWCKETWARVNSECGPGFAYKIDGAFHQPDYDGPNFGAGPSFNYDKYPGDYCMWYSDLIGGATAEQGYRWTSSTHMPRWASRLTLEITSVRVERAGEISEEDAVGCGFTAIGCGVTERCVPDPETARDQFREFWQSTYGSIDGWCWVLGVRVRHDDNR